MLRLTSADPAVSGCIVRRIRFPRPRFFDPGEWRPMNVLGHGPNLNGGPGAAWQKMEA